MKILFPSLLILVVLMAVWICQHERKYGPAPLKSGQIVTSKIDGKEGMFLHRTLSSRYAIRFPVDHGSAFQIVDMDRFEFDLKPSPPSPETVLPPQPADQ